MILTLAVILHLWGVKKIAEIRKQFKFIFRIVKYLLDFRRKELELKKLQRKAAPFLQAMSDIRLYDMCLLYKI